MKKDVYILTKNVYNKTKLKKNLILYNYCVYYFRLKYIHIHSKYTFK